MKRLIAWAVTGMMVLSLFAVGGVASATAGKPTLKIFMSKVEISDALAQMGADYQAATGVNVEVWGTPGDGYSTQLQTKLASGQGPTVFQSGGPVEAAQMAQYMTDLSNESYIQYILPGMAETLDGKTVGVPLDIEGYGYVYNKSLVDAGKVTDVASLKTVMDGLKGQGINPLSLSSESYFLIGHSIAGAFSLQPDMQGFISQLNAGKVTMADDPIFQDWAQLMVNIRDTSTNPLDVTYDSQIAGFATGKTAMIQQGNWCYGMFADYKDAMNFDMGLMPIPVKGNDKIFVGAAGYWAINAQAPADEIQAGKDFLTWLFTSSAGQDYITNKFGFVPAMSNIVNANLDPISQAVVDAGKAGTTLQWATTFFPSGIIDNYLLAPAQKFFSTPDETAAQFLADLDAAWAAGVKQ